MTQPEHTQLTERSLQRGLVEIERRVEAKLLTQRNYQHEALEKVLDAQRDFAGEVGKLMGAHAALLQHLYDEIVALRRPWWQKLLGRFGMSEQPKVEPYPCPLCGANNEASHRRDCPRWNSGNVTVTPTTATLSTEGH